MTVTVVAAVLVAAMAHASWNALAHAIKDQLVAFTLIAGCAAALGAVTACFVPLPHAAAWPYLVASALLHLGYQLLLMRSFSLGDFGQMYPIARGTAPLVVTVLAAVLVDETPAPWQLAGVALASAGLVGVALWGFRGGAGGRGEGGTRARPQWPALLAALTTGLSIAAYTVVDGIGVRASGSPVAYIAWLMLLQGVLIPAYACHRLRGSLLTRLRPHAVRGFVGAVLSLLAYGLVLWAQTRAPMAPVAALRESSIIVGAAIGALFFKERFGGPRLVAAGLMVVGIGLMLRAG
ncbi:DMT family transporter [Streptomyces wuyuanensis]|uniref:EamA-like transporter family protein n=1 Tax=Streptomyces wuyuanensis TaxID=1196353 RepID=A0A1G9V2L4_9ACTN|nr:DMT family transporter [Streptomyces wuyuanensis]SDM66246.1 EamA-like transporter family protein [Streptomyces wuyuanensis]